MSRFDKMIAHLPEQFKNKQNIDVLIKAFADELDELDVMWEQLRILRSLDKAEGVQLDKAGSIVVLTRAEASKFMGNQNYDEIDDEKYRMFLKYKALRNATTCNYEDLMAGCRILFDADPIYYSEDDAHPASFSISIGTDLDENLLNLVRNTDLSIRASGVKVNTSVFAKTFFGFSDTNRYALGFGQGKFAQEV